MFSSVQMQFIKLQKLELGSLLKLSPHRVIPRTSSTWKSSQLQRFRQAYQLKNAPVHPKLSSTVALRGTCCCARDWRSSFKRSSNQRKSSARGSSEAQVASCARGTSPQSPAAGSAGCATSGAAESFIPLEPWNDEVWRWEGKGLWSLEWNRACWWSFTRSAE